MKTLMPFLLSVAMLCAGSAVNAEQIRYNCGGTHVEYDGWGKRTEQMSSLKEDPLDVVVDTTARKISFNTRYAGKLTADLQESQEWFDGEAPVDLTVMGRKIAFVSVKVGRVAWQAMTVYTLDSRDGENHIAFAGVCTPIYTN
ncbi:MAG: hypothetical protein WBJ21_05115 [Burkholderiaceae bacterium]